MISLNEAQKKAANFHNGIASVLAVPGSGKTLTMSYRIANLIKKGVMPENILGLTFTRNAAHAMRIKIQPILGDKASRVILTTIHSFCHGLLRNEGKVFEILSGEEQMRFLRKIIKKKKIKNLPIGMVLQEIGLAKNNLVSPAEFRDLYEGEDTMQKIADIYAAYEEEKRKRMLLDFNDLLTETHKLLKGNNEILERCQQTFKHVLIDEFQDTNPAQMEILNLIIGDVAARNGSSFWICGDDQQSIFGFTGACISNILNFSQVYPSCKQFILDMNYRSTPQIINVCQRLIEHNSKKIEKTLKSVNNDGEDMIVIDAANEEDEAIKVLTEIRDLISRRGFTCKDIAVLYRANSQSRVIEEEFSRQKIPYHIENGMNFYQRPEVKTLLDYLRLIHDPNTDDGDEALRAIINKPNRYIGQRFMKDLEQYAEENNLHLYEALKNIPIEVPYQRKYVREFLGLLGPLVKDAKTMEPAELIYLLREGLEYDRHITEDSIMRPDDSKIANINQLQIAAGKYADIGALLNYTDSFQEEMSNRKDGISLMSIHKSKRLEFPVVFIIGMIEGILPSKQGDIEEERRVAFVGISRAMSLLYLSYPQKYLGRAVKQSTFLLEMLGEN